MQTSAEAPAVAPTPQVSTTTAEGKTIPIAVPQSEADMRALYARRQDIRDQLASLTNRRHSLVTEIRSAPDGVARTGLEQRVSLIDQNILQYEKELSSISQQISSAPPELLQVYTEPADQNHAYNDGWEEGIFTGGFTVAGALAIVWLARRWRRKRKGKFQPASERNESPRLERLEQGMDAIAIEIERISEGQRFVTRLLSESRDPVAARIQQSPQAVEAPR